MSTPPIYGRRSENTPTAPPPGAPDSEDAVKFNAASSGPRRRRGRTIGTVLLLTAAGALVLSGAVTVVLRLGATVSMGPAVAVSLLLAVAVIATVIHLLGGKDGDGRRSWAAAIVLAVLIVVALASVGLSVWAVL